MLRDYIGLFLDWLKRVFTSRLFYLGAGMIALFAILVVRLFQLQIVNGQSYYENYVETTKTEITTKASRGNIYDYKGNLLAGNTVSYSVTIKDLGKYTSSNGEFNEMLLSLVRILNRFNEDVNTEIPVVINENDEFEYSGTEAKVKQFIKDVYTKDYIEAQAEEGVDIYSYDAETVMKRLMEHAYNFTKRWPNVDTVSKQEALSICNIRYMMAATSFTKYKSTTICSNISSELSAAILENKDTMLGVEITEEVTRTYPDGVYFSGILGYTGVPSQDQLDELKLEDDSYEATDLVGKEGIEQVYEQQLSGTKGSETVYLNNVGIVMDTIDSTDPVSGNDIYLTIDHDLQIASYNLLEQRLSMVIVDKLVNEDFTPDETVLADEFRIPVKDAYFQMINNNILDMEHFAEDDASETESDVYQTMVNYQQSIMVEIRNQLMDETADAQENIDENMAQLMSKIYTYLSDQGVLVKASIDSKDETVQAWKNEKISLGQFLRYAISKEWIDSSVLEGEEKYSNSAQMYEKLVNYTIEKMQKEESFLKILYKILIHDEQITGNQICILLAEQGIIDASESDIQELKNGDSETAYEYMKNLIAEIKITPAQLALDPCSGSVIVVDEKTGEIRALVSYPGYDLNRFSGTVDTAYWKEVNEDLSQPLYNRATQSRTSPGSTFKMITATAGLEEGVVSKDEYINCVGIFDKLDHPMCWIAREQEGGHHGLLNTIGGLAHSCNFYFYEVGYRLSLNENGVYVPSRGVEMIQKYAGLYGIGEPSGIEIRENLSQATTEYPVTSAIGQGTNNFTTVSLARYATAVATSGKVYNFQLLDKIYDADGTLIQDDNPEVERQLEFAPETWDVLHQGMFNVVHGDGSSASVFTDLEVDIAGKSGSAQENKLRGNHGLFVSFGPYTNPEIVVAVSIPNSYTAANAGLVSKEVYRYYLGYKSLDDILNYNYIASDKNVTVGD